MLICIYRPAFSGICLAFLEFYMIGHIVFCTDDRYAKYLSVLIYSILVNTKEPLKFYVLFSSLSGLSRDTLNHTVAAFSDKNGSPYEIRFIKVDIKSILENKNLNVSTFRECFDPYTRLFLPEILKDYHLDKIIYLDVDMVCKGDIKELLDVHSTINTFGGVLDTVSINLKYPLITPSYINSGMLLISLNYLKQIDFINKCVEFINKQKQEDLICPDQDIINNVIPAKDLILVNQRFNEYSPKKEKVNKALILHYTGPYKPWMEETRWRLKKVYWIAYRDSLVAFLKNSGKLSKKDIACRLKLLRYLRVLFNLKLSLKNLFAAKTSSK